MFVVSAACRKEICFPALCSAMPLWMTFLFLYIQELFILFIYFFKCQFVFLDIFPPSQHFHFLHLNVRNTFKGHLSIDKHFLCTWPACCSQPPLDSKLPAGLLQRTDMTWLCCCTEKRGPSTLSSMAILGGGWWESQLQDFINELHRRPQGTKRA